MFVVYCWIDISVKDFASLEIPLLRIALVSNMDVAMSAYDFCSIFFLQPDGKTILLGTELGEMKEFNLMTGQVKENLSPCYHRHHHHRDCIGHFIIKSNQIKKSKSNQLGI